MPRLQSPNRSCERIPHALYGGEKHFCVFQIEFWGGKEEKNMPIESHSVPLDRTYYEESV